MCSRDGCALSTSDMTDGPPFVRYHPIRGSLPPNKSRYLSPSRLFERSACSFRRTFVRQARYAGAYRTLPSLRMPYHYDHEQSQILSLSRHLLHQCLRQRVSAAVSVDIFSLTPRSYVDAGGRQPLTTYQIPHSVA